MKKKNILFYLIELIFVILFIFSSYKVINWYIDNNKNKEILDDISTSIKIDKNDNYSINFNELKDKNSDTVGYIKVNNTNIEYPIVKYKDNEYYLNHNFNKEYNKAGWIYANYLNKFDDTDKNIVIFGHNMRNLSMFGTLKYTLENQWQNDENNHYITLVTENNQYTYQVFSTYKIQAEDYYIKTSFNDDNEYIEFLNTIKSRSNYNYNVELTKDDTILTLSTCDVTSKNRVVLHAKKIN